MKGRSLLTPFRELLQLFLPATCIACGQPLVGDECSLCVRCMMHLPLAYFSAAPNNATELRLMGRVRFEAATSLLLFHKQGITQSIVHAIKYYDDETLGITMGRMMGRDLLSSGRFSSVDCVVPVPLHRGKLRRRGYNQSLLLCRGIAEVCHLPIVANNLIRVVNTESQTHKNGTQRIDNMDDAFQIVDSMSFEGRHILLVDDVITTGSTIAECADVLLSISGVRVSLASLAITDG